MTSSTTKTTTATKQLLITKGALHNVLDVCSYAEMADGNIVDISIVKKEIQHRFEELGDKGFRILGVCYRDIENGHDDYDNEISSMRPSITKAHEANMTFVGFLIFFDPVKPDVTESISNLKRLGISLKIVTGDNRHVATYVGQQIGAIR